MANVQNLKIIRLLSGEEIMAEITVDGTDSMTIKNPIRIVVVPNQADPKNPTVGLAPFLQFSDDKELVLNKNCVITSATPLVEFVNQYNSVFGGLVVPSTSAKIITP